MDNTNVAPVNHGVLSATGTVAASSATSFVKGGAKGWGYTGVICTAVGGLLGAASVIGLSVGMPIWVGLGLGALVGFGPLGMAVGALSSGVGLFTGAKHGITKVTAEKGAANAMQAQVEAYKAEAQAQAIAAANDNKYNFPPQGSQFNQAGTTVNVVQPDGRIHGQQLQRA